MNENRSDREAMPKERPPFSRLCAVEPGGFRRIPFGTRCMRPLETSAGPWGGYSAALPLPFQRPEARRATPET